MKHLKQNKMDIALGILLSLLIISMIYVIKEWGNY